MPCGPRPTFVNKVLLARSQAHSCPTRTTAYIGAMIIGSCCYNRHCGVHKAEISTLWPVTEKKPVGAQSM